MQVTNYLEGAITGSLVSTLSGAEERSRRTKTEKKSCYLRLRLFNRKCLLCLPGPQPNLSREWQESREEWGRGGEKSVLVKHFGRHFGSGECSWSGDLPHSSGPNEWSVTGAGLRCAHGGQLK